MSIKFTIPGKPQAKQRPRVTRYGAYTPKETLMYENLVKCEYMSQVGERLDGCIKATIKAYFEVPKSTSKKRKAMMLDGRVGRTQKPDCDNLAKSVLDALNGVAYRDDSQIVELHVCKGYAEEARVECELEELQDLE